MREVVNRYFLFGKITAVAGGMNAIFGFDLITYGLIC